MQSHLFRAKAVTMIDPTPENIVTARHRAGHTQIQAAAAVGSTARTWQDWERGSRMPLAAWWLYLLRIGCITIADLPVVPERNRASRKSSGA